MATTTTQAAVRICSRCHEPPADGRLKHTPIGAFCAGCGPAAMREAFQAAFMPPIRTGFARPSWRRSYPEQGDARTMRARPFLRPRRRSLLERLGFRR